MEVRNVVIIANLWKSDSMLVAGQIREYLESTGRHVDVFMTENLDEKLDISIRTDLLISVGGDGTVLYCARLVQDLGIPILAVNLGTFGFITEIACDEWKAALDDVIADRERISRRLMLKVSVLRSGSRIFQCQGLNEAVVTSAGVAKVVNLDLYIGRTRAGTFRCDGIIIADEHLTSLKRFKDDVKEVAKGYECGMGIEKFNDLKVGDIFEAYTIEEYRD